MEKVSLMLEKLNIDGSVRVDHELDVTKGTTEISNLELNFDFKTLEFGRTGLSVKKLPASELRRVLNSLGKMYFKQNMKNASTKLSDILKNQTNSILANRNRDQLIQFLEKHLNVLRKPPSGVNTVAENENTQP